MPRRPQVIALDPGVIAGAAEMIRALGHPVRLRLVEALGKSERCVSELQQVLDAPQAIISQQLSKMRAAGIVACRREGVNMRYSVADDRVLRMLDCLRQAPARQRQSRTTKVKENK